jgi:hypothetical protein
MRTRPTSRTGGGLNLETELLTRPVFSKIHIRKDKSHFGTSLLVKRNLSLFVIFFGTTGCRPIPSRHFDPVGHLLFNTERLTRSQLVRLVRVRVGRAIRMRSRLAQPRALVLLLGLLFRCSNGYQCIPRVRGPYAGPTRADNIAIRYGLRWNLL